MYNVQSNSFVIDNSFWGGYTPSERQRFIFHTVIAFLSLPFYYLFPFKFGLIMSPYLFCLAMRPKSEYILPVIIQCIYGSQQRYFFALGCFFYVLFHFNSLRRFGLHWIYLLYISTLPYFIWFFWEKMHMPMFDPGIGARLGGLFTHFVFSIGFWAALVVRKTGRPFFRGMIIWSFLLIVVMAVIGGGATLDIYGTGEGAARSFFSRMIFWSMPFISSSLIYLLVTRNRGFGLEKLLCVIGCLILVLDFFHLTHCPMSFTMVGLCLFSMGIVWVSLKWRARTVLCLNPLIMFILSATFVFASAYFVENYGRLYKDEGDYNEMSMTSIDSILKKIQRKAVDDRANVWAGTIAYIKRDIIPNPIWVKPKQFIEFDAQSDTGHSYVIQWSVGAHNTMLDLIKQHGFYGGLGLYLVFIWFYCRKQNRRFISDRENGPMITVMAVCISQGVVGGHCGHYLLEMAFGIAIGCCLGVCWGRSSKVS